MLLLDLCFCPLSIFPEVSRYVCLINKCTGLVSRSGLQNIFHVCGAADLCPQRTSSAGFSIIYSSQRLLAPPRSPTLRLPVPRLRRRGKEASQPSASQAVVQRNPSSRWLRQEIWCRKPVFWLLYPPMPGRQQLSPFPARSLSTAQTCPAQGQAQRKLVLIFHSHLKNSASRCCYCAEPRKGSYFFFCCPIKI